jgi:hypothetical protein
MKACTTPQRSTATSAGTLTLETALKTSAEFWINHQKTVIRTFSARGETTLEIWAHAGRKPIPMEGLHPMTSSGPRLTKPSFDSQGEFMGHLIQYHSEVIAAIGDAISVLIFGPGEAKMELGRQLWPALVVARIPSMDTVVRMTDRQITDRARDHLYN